jgi:uncharacterized protein YbbC (DUF1343 family)
MRHNEASARVFRMRSVGVLLLAAILAVFCPASSVSLPRLAAVQAAKHTKSGIDVLEEQKFALLRGKRVGVITNQTGVDSQGRRTIDVLAHAEGVKLVAIFSPEHGILSNADAPIANSKDAVTGLPIYSLYGDTRRPTAAMLKGINALVFDIQDAGVRFYTYTTTMAYCMEEAAKRHIAFIVLDRPDPINGETIEGPMLDPDRLSFTGYFPMPVRYAMTLGELAQMFNAENKIGANLHVVGMQDWKRNDDYDQTGLAWIPPSPNLRTVDAAFLYPGIEILQAGGISVGRGTATPFELLGAPWIQADAFAGVLIRRKIPGVTFGQTGFTPSDGVYAGEPCEGITIKVVDRSALGSMRVGLEIADVLRRMYQDKFDVEKTIALLGSKSTVEQLAGGDRPKQIIASWDADLEKFRALRAKYLIYQ